MSAVKKTAEIVPVTPASTPATEAATIMAMIERLATNPDIPVERTEQLFALYQRVQADAARKSFDAAFAAMQPELPIIGKAGDMKDREGKSRGKYALWEDIAESIVPVLSRHGFGLSFRPKVEDGVVSTVAILSRDGHREISGPFPVPFDKSGGKNDAQAIGSATSYGKRYTAISLLNIILRGEDDDARKTGIGELIDDEQALALRRLIEDAHADTAKLLEVAKAERIEDIRAADFPKIKAILEKRIKLAKQESGR